MPDFFRRFYGCLPDISDSLRIQVIFKQGETKTGDKGKDNGKRE